MAATYQVQGPGGATYSVEGPEDADPSTIISSLGNPPATPAPQMSGPQLLKASISSYASHPFTTGLGMLENSLSAVTGGFGSLADALTGASPGTHDFTYRPRTAAGQEQAAIIGNAGGTMGQAYDSTFGTGPLAQTLKERVPEFAGAAGTLAMLPEIPKAVSGLSKLPLSPLQSAPSAQLAARIALLKAGQDQGYVVPPSTGNPTLTNKLLGGIAGKTKVQQLAQATNRDATLRAANSTIGQAPDFVPTPDNLKAVSEKAFQTGYVPVKSAGEMSGDDTLNSAIDAITNRSQGANRSFPGAFKSDPELQSTLAALKQPKFDAGDAIDAIAELRARANDAYGSGQATVGQAYKGASKALEDAIERNLASRGQDGAQMLKNYRAARTTIAQTNSIQDALTGDEPDAVKLANQLQSGKPLSGPIKTAAQMASVRAFRPSMALPSGAAEGISPLDVYGAVGGAIATGNMLPLAIPFTREGLARYLISPRGQARAIPKAFRPQPPPSPPPGLISQIGQLSPAAQSLFNTPSNP